MEAYNFSKMLFILHSQKFTLGTFFCNTSFNINFYQKKQNFKRDYLETLFFGGFATITFEQVNGFTIFLFLNKGN